MRNRHIDAAKILFRQIAQKIFEPVRRNFERLITAGDAVFLEPVIMQARRQRMRNRPAYDPRFYGNTRHDCAVSAGCALMARSSARWFSIVMISAAVSSIERRVT